MKAVRITKFLKTLDDVTVSDVDTPALKPGHVLVQVKAAGVNFVDTLYARGLHQNNRRHVQPPFTLGLEFAGVVVDIDHETENETVLRKGDRVYGSSLGAYAEKISVPAFSLTRLPPGWSYAAAAGMAATAPVSYGALVTRGRIHKGETVLVLGAAGGLGCMAVQIAAAAGCRVIAVASSAEKCAVARQCGAEVCIDSSQDGQKPWWERVLEATPNSQGVDVVFDSVGAVGNSLKCLAHRGRILVVGFAARDNTSLEQVAMNRVLLKQATVIGYRYGESLRRDPVENAQIWRGLEALIDADKIRPVVYEKAYEGLESVPTALKDNANRRVWGKTVVIVDNEDGLEERRTAKI